MRKPVRRFLHDGNAQCVSEDYDDMGDGAFGVQIDAFLCSSEEVLKLIKFLNKAHKWMEHKEQYGVTNETPTRQ